MCGCPHHILCGMGLFQVDDWPTLASFATLKINKNARLTYVDRTNKHKVFVKSTSTIHHKVHA